MRLFDYRTIPLPRLSFDLEPVTSQSPLDLEIGAGQGLHAIHYAKLHPQRTLIAVERTATRFAKMQARHSRHSHLVNLWPVNADALSIVVHFIKDHSLDRIFLLYPNPYPKTKQANLRWHNMPFMAVLKQRLIPGGELILATNIEHYADEAQEQMTSEWKFILTSRSLVSNQSSPRTHFEKKYLERGERCWNLTFVKPG